MNDSQVLLLAFLMGAITGLRALTAPAVVAWGAHVGWLNLRGSWLSFVGSTSAVVIFTLLAIGELIADQLPSTPSRLKPPGLIARVVFGALSGAAIAASGTQSIVLGSLLGAVGGVAGALAGYQARTRLGRALHVPDFVVACLEDVAAIGGGFLIVSRF